MIARAPEALLLIRGGKVSIETLQQRPGWSSLPAIQKGRVYYVDSGIQEPSPVAIDALEELAREFHPWDGSARSSTNHHGKESRRRCESATTP